MDADRQKISSIPICRGKPEKQRPEVRDWRLDIANSKIL
jgi:hypothetical protein